MTEDAPLISMSSPDRCPSCGADMSPDQHYCVECGNRRGKPRFSIDNNKKPAPPPPPVQRSSSRRVSSGATLLLGLLVLMLALWTGVQLGNNGTGTPVAYQKQPKIVINNTGGGSGGGGGSTTASSNNSDSNGSGSSKAAKGNTKAPTKAQQKAALNGQATPKVDIHNLHTKKQRKAATKKVLNQKTALGNGKQLGSEKTTLGSKCSDNTVGCSNGKYTGSYFGG